MWPIEVKTAFHIKLGSRDCLLMIGGRGNIYKKNTLLKPKNLGIYSVVIHVAMLRIYNCSHLLVIACL